MTRTDALKIMSARYPYINMFKKLGAAGYKTMEQYLKTLDQLGHLEFEYAVNRLFLYTENKPSNWTIICDLLVSANSMVHTKERK